MVKALAKALVVVTLSKFYFMGSFRSLLLLFSLVLLQLCVNGLLRYFNLYLNDLTSVVYSQPFQRYFSSFQVKKHSSYLMTVEMSIVGSLCLLASTTKSPDGEAIRQHGYFYGWTPLTMVMILPIMQLFSKITMAYLAKYLKWQWVGVGIWLMGVSISNPAMK